MATNITHDEIIERGLAAVSLLENPTFHTVLKALTIECFARFTESKPDDLTAREDTYNLHRGLQAIEHELRNMILAKDEAVARIDAANEDHDDLEGPIYIQGNTDR